LAVGLVAAVLVAVDARRDAEAARDDAAAAVAAAADLEQRLAEATAPPDSGDAGGGEGDAGAEGGDRGPLEDLLEGILGGELPDLDDLLGGLGGGAEGALGGVDPACVIGDPSDLAGGILQRGGVEGSYEEQVTAIAEAVAEERGLAFEREPAPEFVPADEFDARIGDLVAAEYPAEQADLDSRLLQALGAVPRGTDLKALQEDLLAGQVAGYYDPDSGEIVVRVADGEDSLDVAGQITLAHELDHMLTDQALGLPDTERAGSSDSNLAALALVEGDATLLMQRWALTNIGLLDQLGQAFAPEAAAAQEDLEQVPPYLREELLFPYTTGLAYACRLFVDGGWEAVDAAYDDPPATTAEVLFDDGATEAVDVDVAGAPEGWEIATTDTFGAAPLSWLFAAPGGDESAAVVADDALRSWAGGRVRLFVDGPDSAVSLVLAAGDDGVALCEAVDQWYSAAFGGGERDGDTVSFDGTDQDAVLRCVGAEVRLGIAPDLATAARLA
jgi:hypothetical protein